MIVLMGNVDAKEGYYVDADYSKWTDEAVLAEAQASGVSLVVKGHVVDSDGNPVVGENGDVEGTERPATRDELIGRLAGRLRWRKLDGNRVTMVQVPPGVPLDIAFRDIAAAGTGAWANVSDAPPAWIETKDEAMALLLSSHFKCPKERPADWSGMG